MKPAIQFPPTRAILPWFLRLGIFLALYLLIIKGHPLLTKALYKYYVTHHEPYALLLLPLLLVAFGLISLPKIRTLPNIPQRWSKTWQYALLALAALLLPPPHFLQTSAYSPLLAAYLTVLTTIALIFFFLAIFPRPFIKHFSRELSLLMTIFPFAFVLLQFTDLLALRMSAPVVWILAKVLPYIFPGAVVILQQSRVLLNGFNVGIGPPCSGIVSLMIFSIFFALSILMLRRWYKIKKIPALAAWLVGAGTLYLINILRVIILIGLGAFYSSALALKLFHEFFSAIIVSLFFLVYLYKIIPHLTVPFIRRQL